MNKLKNQVQKLLKTDYQWNQNISDFSEVYKTESNNDFSILKPLEDKIGIYFFLKNNNEILYIGYTINQDLRIRIRQHLKEKDSGGRFRINYMSKNNVTFEKFKELIINDIKILSISIKKEDIEISESDLIEYFKPKYNV